MHAMRLDGTRISGELVGDDEVMCVDHDVKGMMEGDETMNTAMTLAAVAIGWAALSGSASAQTLGSTVIGGSSLVAAGSIGASEEDASVDDASVDDASADATSALDATRAAEAVAKMEEWLGTFDRLRDGLARNDGFIRTDDELVLAFLFEPMEGESQLLRQYMKSVAVAMRSVPDSFYERLDRAVDGLRSEIDRLAPALAPITGAEAEGALREAIERRVAQAAPDAKVVRTVLSGDGWNLKLNEMGLPKSEYRKGYVMYQLPNYPLVVCQQYAVERRYFGGAESADDYSVKLGYLRLQSSP
jgi:hypothetical protein